MNEWAPMPTDTSLAPGVTAPTPGVGTAPGTATTPGGVATGTDGSATAAPTTPGAVTTDPAVPGTATTPSALPTTPATATTPGTTTPPSAASDCVPGIPGSTQLPRLTNAQYERTIYDLLGTPSPGLLAIEQAGPINKTIWDGYQSSADSIAATVMADPALKANFMTCTPTGDGAACLSDTIQQFGRRAYRRPLTAEETAGYEALIAQRADLTPTGAVDEVAELILSTFLKSPSFLQRAEMAEVPTTGGFKLSSYEVAARLSYMLWGSMPDAALDAAADADQLQTKEQVLAQAQRMVADPKAKDVAQAFHRQYLHLTSGSRWDSATKDATLFPAFTNAVIPDMINETEMLFDSVFMSGGTFQDLFTTNVGFVTSRTAALYGLPNPNQYGDTPTEVQLQGRPGFLTRIGFLAAYSKQTRTNPILRGAFITKDVLGIDPGAPDPAAAMTELPTDPGLDTVRKKVDAMTANSPCSGCHTPLINPPGFVLEAFDATGNVQTAERDTGAPIDTVADVLFSRTGVAQTIANPTELMTKLAESVEAQRYYTSRWVGFAYERVLAAPDVCAVDALTANVTAGGYSIQNLLTDLTQTDSFLTRALEVTP